MIPFNWNFAEIFGNNKLESVGLVCMILGLATFVELPLVTDGQTDTC